MIIDSVKSALSLRQVRFDFQDNHKPKEQKLAFGKAADSYERSGRDVTKRILTEGAVGVIFGLGMGLLSKQRGSALLKSAGSNALFLIGFSELWNIVAKPVSKIVDNF